VKAQVTHYRWKHGELRWSMCGRESPRLLITEVGKLVTCKACKASLARERKEWGGR